MKRKYLVVLNIEVDLDNYDDTTDPTPADWDWDTIVGDPVEVLAAIPEEAE